MFSVCWGGLAHMPVCVCQCVCVHMLACMREHTCMPRVHTGVKGRAHHLPAAMGQRPITFVADVATRPKIGGFAGRRCSRYFQIYDPCDTRSTALRSCQHTLGSANYWEFLCEKPGSGNRPRKTDIFFAPTSQYMTERRA